MALQHWTGLACFAAAYRRPPFSILQDVFTLTSDDSLLVPSGPRRPTESIVDELLLFAGCALFASGNLHAQLHEAIAISDASLEGGASAKATRFSPLVPQVAQPPGQ